jgi:hypothetical protein
VGTSTIAFLPRVALTDVDRLIALGVTAVALSGAIAPKAHAQGVTTAEIRGSVRLASGASADGAQVTVVNRATHYATETVVRHGRFLAAGLETGGPYDVLVRRLGTVPAQRTGIWITLGERVDLDLVLETTTSLDTMHAVATGFEGSGARAGPSTRIPDALLHRLPALNRDMFDFVRLVPQASVRAAISGAGASTRLNSYLIDGTSTRQLEGNNVPGGSFGKSIPIDAVKEYQVLLAPYDARYGDFAGALVNAVTRSGSDDFEGSAFMFVRNEQLARDTPFLRDTPYERCQLGVSAAGPLVRGRAHWFVASELQRLHQPVRGPYLGQSASSPTPVPVSAADVERFTALLAGYGIDAGTGGRVTGSNPNANVFARVDLAIPDWNSRLVLRHNYVDFGGTVFSRPASTALFPLSSNASTLEATRRSTSFQLFTTVRGSAFNELVVGWATHPFGNTPALRAPRIQVSVPNAVSPGLATLVAGPSDIAQGTTRAQRTFELGDHLTVRPSARHTLGVGARVEGFSYARIGVEGAFGLWTFTNLDSLAAGRASRFSVSRDFSSSPATVRGTHTSAYVADEWELTRRLSVNVGLRGERLAFDQRPNYEGGVTSLFGSTGDAYPSARVHWSPRLGFDWGLDSARRTRVRGGGGVFAGRAPLLWYLLPLRSDGSTIRSLACVGTAPALTVDPATPPTSCANGRTFGSGPVFLIDPALPMPRAFRSSLALDHRLWGNIGATVEALYSRTLSDLRLDNRRLVGPRGTDRRGRVLYGSIGPTGVAIPDTIPGYPEVFALRSQSSGHALFLTALLDVRLSDGLQGFASYTRSRVRDVQQLAPENGAAIAWRSRFVSGRHDEDRADVSSNEVPHRVVLAGTWSAPWQRWRTSLSLYYVGESGAPFTFGDSAVGGLGDLNADGTSANDPIYVPRDAADTAEIVFAGSASEVATQQQAFEQFIESTECLRRQRGRIVGPNSCRAPWANTTNLALRQSLPIARGHELSVQLEVFNLLNLLHADWGMLRVPNAALLQHVGQTTGSSPQPIFRYDPARVASSTQNVESAYQLQLGVRYAF